MCFAGSAWELLNDTILSLSKKRLLIKFAIAKMVSACCTFVEKMPVSLTIDSERDTVAMNRMTLCE